MLIQRIRKISGGRLVRFTQVHWFGVEFHATVATEKFAKITILLLQCTNILNSTCGIYASRISELFLDQYTVSLFIYPKFWPMGISPSKGSCAIPTTHLILHFATWAESYELFLGVESNCKTTIQLFVWTKPLLLLVILQALFSRQSYSMQQGEVIK